MKVIAINRSLIAVVMLFSAVFTAQAQDVEDNRSDLTLGVRSGVNFSNVWDEEGDDFAADGKVGFVGGVFMGIPAGDVLGFQPELLISQKGFQATGTIFGNPYSYRKNTTFLDVPLQLQIKPSPMLTILVGPQYSFLLMESNTYTFNGTSGTEEEAVFENEDIRKTILGATVGIDLNFDHLVISGRACGDLQNNRENLESTTPRYKNQWVQLTIGLKL